MSNLCRRSCLWRAGRQAVASGADLLQALTAIAVVGVGCLGLAMVAPPPHARRAPVRRNPDSRRPARSISAAVAGPGPRPGTQRRMAAKNQLEFEVRGGLASDYIYRGVTLSDRRPAVGAAIEATYALLYAGVTRGQRQAADPARRRNIDERRHPADDWVRSISISA